MGGGCAVSPEKPLRALILGVRAISWREPFRVVQFLGLRPPLIPGPRWTASLSVPSTSEEPPACPSLLLSVSRVGQSFVFSPAPPGGLSTMPGREYDKALASVPGDCQEPTSCQTAVATHGSVVTATEAIKSLHLFCAWHSADHLSVLFHLILTITLTERCHCFLL